MRKLSIIAFCIFFVIVFGCSKDTNESIKHNIFNFTGDWVGSYTGDESGSWDCKVDSSGIVRGTVIGLYGASQLLGEVTDDGSFIATAGSVEGGATFKGNMKINGTVNGTWENKYYQLKGKFTGKRAGD